MLGDLELTPVLELEPGRYAKQDYPYPSTAARDDPQGWKECWDRCLADACITGVNEIEGEFWKVRLVEVVDPHIIRKILEAQQHIVGTVEPGASPCRDVIGTLSGGYILKSGHRGLVSPQCCGDLSNLRDWANAAAHRGNEWMELWIGHPTISVRFNGSALEVSGYHEPGSLPESSWHSIDARSLSQACERARVVLREFRQALLPVLERMGFHSPDRTASLLIGERE